ncbi:MAG: D-alanyl-D-alanine carboxypeptidase family protein, partial [Alphaproteobacteria bacterium]
SLDDKFTVSKHAWLKGGSKMFVEVGKEVTVEDLLRGIIIQSGNDASIVVAEGLAGSEEAFAEEMNAEAEKLGLENSHFVNATGWPAEGQEVSVRDLSIIALRTIHDFPEHYHYYAEKEFTYSGIRQTNRNPLLYAMKDADGLKTGHTEAIGYGLTASAERDGRRLVLVLNGLPSERARAQESQRILEWGFREFDNYQLFKAGEEVETARVWLGQENTVPLIIKDDLVLTLPRQDRKEMEVSLIYSEPIPAPVMAGTEIAKVIVKVADKNAAVVPLVAGANVEQLGFFGRMGAAMSYLLWGVSH